MKQVMAAEEKSNRLATSRRRYQLEQVLIQKGVAVKLQQLEEVEENTTQMARVLKKAPTWQHVPLVTKNRAALERKNMVLRRRAHQPEPTPMHAVVRPKMERTPSGGLLTKQRLLQVGVLTSEIRGLGFCRDVLGGFEIVVVVLSIFVMVSEDWDLVAIVVFSCWVLLLIWLKMVASFDGSMACC